MTRWRAILIVTAIPIFIGLYCVFNANDAISDRSCAILNIAPDGEFTVQPIKGYQGHSGPYAGYLSGIGPIKGDEIASILTFIDENVIRDYISAARCDDGTIDIIYLNTKTNRIQNLNDDLKELAKGKLR